MSAPPPSLHKFVFAAAGGAPRLEVRVPELVRASYSSYTWPCAPVLAWFLWSQRQHLRGRRVLELGAGTALPGILAAKCGAVVTLTDSFTLSDTLRQLTACCLVNGLTPGRDITVAGLTWGLFLGDALVERLPPFDLILGSDCLYEPAVFEDLLSTVAHLLERGGAHARFLTTYQERSSDWSLEALLDKWGLKCRAVELDHAGDASGIDYRELMGGHSVHLLEITCA